MPAEDDITLDEKRVYGETREETVLYVASATGLTRVEVSGDQIGRFDLAVRDAVVDVAGDDGRLLVATDEDVLVGTADGFASTGFGAAVTVGVGDRPLAASPDGRISTLEGNKWLEVGSVAEPRALDGDLLATGAGVYRVASGLQHLGLDDVTDVARAGPYAATVDGLYRLGDGQQDHTRLREGGHDVVAAERAVAVEGGRAHAVGPDGLVERAGESWVACEVTQRVVDVAYGESVYAVTAGGEVLVDADPEATPDGQGGWRSRAVGARDPRAIAVP